MTQIKKLEIRNYVGIRELELIPGKINVIKGKNGKAKTSVLEALEKAFNNNERRVEVINEDGEKAEIVIELDDGHYIRRSQTENGKYLDVKENGFNKDAPQTYLNSLIGQYGFNPVDFIQEDPETQTEIILNLLDIEVTEEDAREWVGEDIELPTVDYDQHGLEVIDQLYDKFYSKRRDKNAEQKQLKADYIAEKKKIPEEFDPEEYRGVTLKEKYQKLQQAQEHNKKIDKTVNLIEKWDNKIDNKQIKIDQKKEKIRKLEQEIKELEGEQENIEKQKQKAQNFLNNNEKIDTTELEKEVEEFEEKKELVNTYDRYQDKKDKYKETNQEWQQLDEIVKMLREKPKELAEQTDLPVEGLEIKDNEVLIDGRPIKNLSTGEQILLALDIARETAKDIKLICIDRFESLDPDNQEMLFEEMQKDDFQYFVTEVSGDEELNVVTITEDGRRIDQQTGEVLEEEPELEPDDEFEAPF